MIIAPITKLTSVQRLGHFATPARKFLTRKMVKNVMPECAVVGREEDNRRTIIQEAE
jgi:hypothetical protein